MKKLFVIVSLMLAIFAPTKTVYAEEVNDQKENETIFVDGYEIDVIPGAPAEVYQKIAEGKKEQERLDNIMALRNDPNSDLYILAHIINGEAGGCEWCSDTMCYYVGSVVLNRVGSDIFPNSISDVAFQSGQYACTWDGNYNKPMLERSWLIAEELLENGSVLPDYVLYQANFSQGNVYCQEQNMYFCY